MSYDGKLFYANLAEDLTWIMDCLFKMLNDDSKNDLLCINIQRNLLKDTYGACNTADHMRTNSDSSVFFFFFFGGGGGRGM